MPDAVFDLGTAIDQIADSAPATLDRATEARDRSALTNQALVPITEDTQSLVDWIAENGAGILLDIGRIVGAVIPGVGEVLDELQEKATEAQLTRIEEKINRLLDDWDERDLKIDEILEKVRNLHARWQPITSRTFFFDRLDFETDNTWKLQTVERQISYPSALDEVIESVLEEQAATQLNIQRVGFYLSEYLSPTPSLPSWSDAALYSSVWGAYAEPPADMIAFLCEVTIIQGIEKLDRFLHPDEMPAVRIGTIRVLTIRGWEEQVEIMSQSQISRSFVSRGLLAVAVTLYQRISVSIRWLINPTHYSPENFVILPPV
jgi:uncharacterized protein YoxC